MLIYVLPQYIDHVGDGCKIKDEKSEKVINIKITQVLKKLCKERMIDFKEIIRKNRKILNQKKVIPLYLNENEILIPIKIRKPRVYRDEVYGYINFYFIDKIEDGYVLLKDGQKIFYIEGKRSVMKRIRMVKILEKEFCDKIKLSYYDLNTPATKEDVLLLLKEIVDLKKLLE